MSSRYQRPAQPGQGLVLQARDYLVLKAVHDHRVMRARHLQQLLFQGVSERICQDRLRRLWAWEYLDRYFLPFLIDGSRRPPSEAGAPIYALGKQAVPVLAEFLTVPREQIPREAVEATPVGLATMEHRLVVTEFLVALQLACRDQPGVALTSFSPEAPLWRALAEKKHERVGAIVPDAAFTLRYPAIEQELSFYVEVVRADVKGGNRRLLTKMQRYVELNRPGFFRQVYGHERLRAVLILTTSEARAEHLRRMARQLEHGRRLFWFGAYHQAGPDERPVWAIEQSTVFSYHWRSVDGDTFTLLVPTDFSPHAAPPAATLPTGHPPDPR